jgi:hypothetical protein
MKFNKATYFAFFFLFCFLASFSCNSFQNFNAKSSKIALSKSNSKTVSTKEDINNGGNSLLLEKNENESEEDFQAQTFLLPFFISFFQYEILQSQAISHIAFAEKLSNPIYISICNFRI